MNVVVDSSALIAYLDDEDGASVVARILEGDDTCYAHGVNLCEVYYHTIRKTDQSTALAAIRMLAQAGVIMREDMDQGFWRQAGQHKAGLVRVSLADCYCIALAQRLGARLVTADHHEFDALAAAGLCEIEFVREPNSSMEETS